MSKNIVIIVIILGSLFRIILGLSSPPNNSYDDHLEPIANYINNKTRPLPQDCWQCYQPPLYYSLASTVFIAAHKVSGSTYAAWKSVQFINIIFSICNLLIISLLLRTTYYRNEVSIAVVIALLSFYPRDIYASVMISNDYLLVLLSSLSVLMFVKFIKNENKLNYSLLCFLVFGCAITKQHGLILLGLIAYIVIKSILNRTHQASNYRYILGGFTVVLCFLDEAWKFIQTGILLVSNQNFFNYTSGQQPGEISGVSFTSFHFIELLYNPFISENTLHSFCTEIFARSWFDYEWRFISPDISSVKYLSTSLFVVGILVTIATLLGMFRYRTKLYKLNLNYTCLVIIALCFFAVPILQTYRFPFFSSMKSQFFLPAISIISLGLYYLLTRKNIIKKYMFAIIFLLVSLGVSHVLFIVFHINISLENLNGPLWEYPFIDLIHTTLSINSMTF